MSEWAGVLLEICRARPLAAQVIELVVGRRAGRAAASQVVVVHIERVRVGDPGLKLVTEPPRERARERQRVALAGAGYGNDLAVSRVGPAGRAGILVVAGDRIVEQVHIMVALILVPFPANEVGVEGHCRPQLLLEPN